MTGDPLDLKFHRYPFEYHPHRDGDQQCVICKRRFRRMAVAHALGHERRGELLACLGRDAHYYFVPLAASSRPEEGQP